MGGDRMPLLRRPRLPGAYRESLLSRTTIKWPGTALDCPNSLSDCVYWGSGTALRIHNFVWVLQFYCMVG